MTRRRYQSAPWGIVLATAALLAPALVALGGSSSGTMAATSCETGSPSEGPAPGSWSETESPAYERSGHTATLLEDGRVLVAGGTPGVRPPEAVPSTRAPAATPAEVYDPETGSWAPTAPMVEGRRDHAAVRLRDGRVLVSGGFTAKAAGVQYITESAEIYDPAANVWAPTDAMLARRARHTATLLPDGEVLVAGGLTKVLRLAAPFLATESVRSAELYDPSIGVWSRTGSMRFHRRHATTASLVSGGVFGKVLREGGAPWGAFGSDTAEVYDLGSRRWSFTGRMVVGRHSHDTVLLRSGRTLALGGSSGGGVASELYDPDTGNWCRTGDMNEPRLRPRATLLAEGRILVAGGSQGGPTAAAEIYDPATGGWTRTDDMGFPRVDHTVTALPDGRVLVVGGGEGRARGSAELFAPGAPG